MLDWQNLLSLCLGWLLGLLSHLILDEIRRYRDRRSIEAGLRSELSEVRHKLVVTSSMIATRVGTVDRELLLWLKARLAEYKGIHSNPALEQALESVLTLTDDQINKLDSHQQLKNGLSIKSIRLPFLDANIASLTEIDKVSRGIVMEAKTQIELLNEEIELAWFWMEKTFDASLSRENLETI